MTEDMQEYLDDAVSYFTDLLMNHPETQELTLRQANIILKLFEEAFLEEIQPSELVARFVL